MARRQVRKETIVDRAGHKVASALELPADAFSVMPRLSMIGNRELIIEGHSGIITYDTEEIQVGGGVFIIRITGRKLEMNSFSQDSIGIRGIIYKIDFLI